MQRTMFIVLSSQPFQELTQQMTAQQCQVAANPQKKSISLGRTSTCSHAPTITIYYYYLAIIITKLILVFYRGLKVEST